MKTCENCKCEHNGEYGSGRFCSVKCSRGFSTKSKRKEINEKVSKKLTKNRDKIIKHCKDCNKLFEVFWNKRNQQFCSRLCGNKISDETRSKLSLARITSMQNGNINGSGKKSIYIFNNKKIKCDSKIENSCLNYFEKLGATSIERCEYIIKYLDGNITRNFLPDFKIILNNKIYIVEAKSYISVNSINEKWRNYNKLSELKKLALISFCKTNNYEFFWFTKDLNIKHYNNN